MIDFQNGKVFKLTKSKKFTNEKLISPLFIENEEFIGEYTALRDFIVFTNKRIIVANIQGFTGNKKDFTSLPYSKIQVFSIETAGTFDMDGELELYFSGLGKVKFGFSSNSNLNEIVKIIGEYVL